MVAAYRDPLLEGREGGEVPAGRRAPGLRLADVFDEEGEPCMPSEEQLRLYLLAERI